jgi:hypothetical protein
MVVEGVQKKILLIFAMQGMGLRMGVRMGKSRWAGYMRILFTVFKSDLLLLSKEMLF